VETLPNPPFSETDTEALAKRVYDYAWQQSEAEYFVGST
jgi:hypothetical protein